MPAAGGTICRTCLWSAGCIVNTETGLKLNNVAMESLATADAEGPGC